MLKDRFFYPLAAIIVAAMILAALSFGDSADLSIDEIRASGYRMSGEDLVRLTAQPGTQAIYVAASGGEPAYARLSSTAARDSLPPGPGVFAPLGLIHERAFAAQNIRMTVTARKSRINGLDSFDIGYFSAGSKDSGWKRKKLTPDWKEYVLDFNPGALTERIGLDHASVWPGETAELLNVDIKSIEVVVRNRPE